MHSIVIATHNPGKLKDMKTALEPLNNQGIKLISLEELGIKEEPEESGQNFEENAILKARFYASKANLPVIADDGGLKIDYLNGEPGVKSRRWPGYEASDQELIDLALQKLQDIPEKDRKAQLQTCVCFYDPKTQKQICEEEHISGHIAEKVFPKVTEGYPFRALFVVNAYDKYYEELTDEEHTKINHRFIAVQRLVEKLKSYLLE